MLNVKDKTYQALGLDDRWTWKKEGSDEYKGLPVWEVIDLDPSYVSYCADRGLLLDNEAFQRLREKL
jgi:hypothetical protein